MNKEILKSILETSSAEFSYEEIQNMLDEELEKNEEEMDTDLIDLCIEVLSRESTEKTVSTDDTKKRNSIRRIFLIAAVVAVLSVLTVSASAEIFSVDTETGIVCIFGKQISLNIKQLRHINENEELSEQDLENINLLPMFLEDNCKLTYDTSLQNFEDNINFNFITNDISGYINIRKNSLCEYNLESIQLLADVEQIKQISVNGISVIIASFCDSNVFAYYNLQNSNYKILFRNSSFEEVLKLLAN